jgi:hypothetical protein
LWSKIFAQEQRVFGWKELNHTYWIPHDQEPFAVAWHNPALLKTIEFDRWAVTSISCPYAYQGTTTEPDYKKFISAARNLGYEIKVAIIGRDQNIVEYQQQRVRGTHSRPLFDQQLAYLQQFNPIYLSTELLYMYKHDYVRSVNKMLDFPVYADPIKLREILSQDPNSKYIKPADEQELDQLVKQVSGLK